jgi:hypothetical protein
MFTSTKMNVAEVVLADAHLHLLQAFQEHGTFDITHGTFILRCRTIKTMYNFCLQFPIKK